MLDSEINEIAQLINQVRGRDSNDEWHSAHFVIMNGGKSIVLMEREYTPDYGSRSSSWEISRHFSLIEALELYLLFEDPSLDWNTFGGTVMKEVIEKHKGFLLDHFSPEELEEHAKKLRETDRLKKRKDLEDKKNSLKKEAEELQSKILDLDLQLGSL